MNTVIKRVVRAEYFFATLFTFLFYLLVAGFPWYWVPISFLLFDISMLGYLVNNKVGALCYNIGHSLIGPTILMAIYILTENQASLFVSLLWLFHIFADRSLGYGLKHAEGFEHTHLGKIGKSK